MLVHVGSEQFLPTLKLDKIFGAQSTARLYLFIEKANNYYFTRILSRDEKL